MSQVSDDDHDWKIFRKDAQPHDHILKKLPEAPPWRQFAKGAPTVDRKLPSDDDVLKQNLRGKTFEADDPIVEMVNAALYLRRPLLLTGKPGSGKSSLIYAVARQLRLGEVLRWPITSRSTLKEGLYEYDAIGRLQAKGNDAGIAAYLKLGALGTALLPTRRPRALLIDEIDKSDIDLPNDLLNVLEEGEFRIPELERLKDEQPQEYAGTEDATATVAIRDFFGQERFPITGGHVRCYEFPFVVLTSNGEREFPAPFLRRCLRFQMPEPDEATFSRIVAAHLGDAIAEQSRARIKDFARESKNLAVATDQLLNAIFLVTRQGRELGNEEKQRVLSALLAELVVNPAGATAYTGAEGA